MGEIEYVGEPVAVVFRRDGTAIITLRETGKRFAMPDDVFRASIAVCTDALIARDLGNIVEFPRPKRGRRPKDETA